jgi:C4-dicarboxylate transporter DctQ subunit
LLEREFYRFVKRWDSAEDWFLVLGLVATAVIVFINVILRYFFGIAITWAEEIVRYITIWFTFIGMDVGVRMSKHLGVDFLVVRFGHRGEAIVRAVVDLIGVAFAVSLAYLGGRLTIDVFRFGQVTPALTWPMGIIYLVVPGAAICTALRYAFAFRRHLSAARTTVVEASKRRASD